MVFQEPSHRLAKYISSLHQKKYRKEERAFLVEGEKNTVELLLADEWDVIAVCVTENFANKYGKLLKNKAIVYTVSEQWLEKNGTLQTNGAAIAAVRIPENSPLTNLKKGEWALALDRISDPGNLGTLIRIADWYGFTKLFCSIETAEWYNPKVIAASMGSFVRVKPLYLNLHEWLNTLPDQTPKIGAFMEGENLHQFNFPKSGGVIVMGSESHGISPEVAKKLTIKITIPRFGGAESLNVGVAAGILCDSLMRNTRA